MTPEQAIQVLDRATQPAAYATPGAMTRADFIRVQQALDILAAAIQPPADEPEPEPE